MTYNPGQGGGYPGQVGVSSAMSDDNRVNFMIQQTLRRVRTMQIVQVTGTSSAGQIAPAGFLNVTLLINAVDGAGNATPHTADIQQIPYIRMQGGANAVILDPQVGDIGWAGFADRDISPVTRSRIAAAFAYLGSVVNRANPGSWRTHDFADGVYIGGILNGVPSQYVAFSSSGISITSPNAITMNAPTITMTAPTITMISTTKVELNTPDTQIDGNLTSGASGGSAATFHGALTATGEVTANGGHTVSAHVHGGVMTGGSNTATPIG